LLYKYKLLQREAQTDLILCKWLVEQSRNRGLSWKSPSMFLRQLQYSVLRERL